MSLEYEPASEPLHIETLHPEAQAQVQPGPDNVFQIS